MRFSTIYIIWLREVKKYLRNRSRIIGSLGMPLLFLVVIGTGIGPMASFAGTDYRQFLMPGIIGMVLLFSSMFAGISVIWDRQFGFLKELLVAPISRLSIVVGKTLGGSTASIIQALLMLVISLLIGIRIQGISGLFLALVFMFLISISFVSVGVAFATRMDDMHGFSLVMNFVIMPIFFLSGAFFTLDNAPSWLATLSYLDPLTYGVDALRFALIGVHQIPLWIDALVLIGFCSLTMSVATLMFRKATL